MSFVPYSVQDFTQRIIDILPQPWWGLEAFQPGGQQYVLVTAIASAFYCLKLYEINSTILQTRILTATGANVDNISLDFFGGTLPRLPGESDSAFAARIIATVLEPKLTIEAIQNAVDQFFAAIISGSPLSLGGVGSLGGSGSLGVSNAVPTVFDTMTDPSDSAIVGLRPSQFCVSTTTSNRYTYGWFIGRANGGFIGRKSFLFPSDGGSAQSALDAVVKAFRAAGCKPIYRFLRSIVNGMNLANGFFLGRSNGALGRGSFLLNPPPAYAPDIETWLKTLPQYAFYLGRPSGALGRHSWLLQD